MIASKPNVYTGVISVTVHANRTVICFQTAENVVLDLDYQ